MRALQKQIERMCGPYSNKLRDYAGLTATDCENVRALEQLTERMCRPYSNILTECKATNRKYVRALQQQIERINRAF